jgi:transcriptional regulator GlxA family with amidase domain
MKNRKIEQSMLDEGRNRVESDVPINAHQIEAAQKIEQSIVYMKQNLDKPLQVATLAAQVSISPSHYFALFKRSTGSAPIDYFTRLRMRRACDLLDGTDLSVKEVATALGYEDPFYFSRVFKSINQVAPSDYRVAHKAGGNGISGTSTERRRWIRQHWQRNGSAATIVHLHRGAANGNKHTFDHHAQEIEQRKVKV